MKRMKKFVCIVLICILLLGVTNIAQAAEPDAEVQMVIDLIAALPDEITLADEATVAAIGELYEELPAEKQQQVSNLAVLQAAQAHIEQLFSAGVAAVDALIAALPQTITLTDEQTIAAAANAYEALTDAQKQAVADHARLAAAQTAISGLKQEAADAVIAQIEALGTDITPEDAQQVADARAAYDALALEIRALITNVQKLLDAEAALAAQTPTTLKTKEEIAEILQDLAGQMKSTITDPTVGTVGGEWTVFCLARFALLQAFEAFQAGAKSAVSVGVACAMAGLIAGCITLTGLASVLINGIVAIAGDATILGLLLTMVCCIVLGMGVPTTANYCIMASTCAPILIQLGIPVVAAHFFVFYFGIVADITPPVALAAYAGSAIAKSKPMKTAVNATKLAIAAFIVPYIFAFNPIMLFEGDASVFEMALVCVTALLGLFCIAAALNGYLFKKINPVLRIVLIAGGLCAMIPGIATDLAGIAAAVAVGAFQYLTAKKREALPAA